MQAKKVIYSGAVLLLIVFAMLIAHFLENSRERRTFAPFFPRFAEQAGKIVLTQRDVSVVLSLRDGRWFVAFKDFPELQYPADSVKVLSVIEKIADMRQDNFVGRNTNNFAHYGLVGDSVYSVQIYDRAGKQVGDFLLGRRAENWRFNHFRLANSNDVFLVGGGIGFAFSSDINEWRDRRLFSFDPLQLTEIITHIDGITSIAKLSGDNWTFADGSEINPEIIGNYIRGILTLSAGDWDYSYSIPDEVSGLRNPSTIHTLVFADGSKITLAIGNQDGELPRFFARVNDNPQIAFVQRSPILRLRLN